QKPQPSQSCFANSLLISSYAALRTLSSPLARARSKALLMIESLNRLKFTGLSQLLPVTCVASSVPTCVDPSTSAGSLEQCHHTHWVSGSKPGWFRHADAW